MHKQFILFIFLILSCNVSAGNQDLLMSLDTILSKKESFVKAKLQKIDFLKQQAKEEHDVRSLIKTYNEIYDEYYVFNFDSAQIYVDRGLQLARQLGDHYYINLNTMMKSQLLAIAGLYSEAIDNINDITPSTLDNAHLFKYYFTYFTLYSYWADYCNDKTYSPQYRAKAIGYLKKAIPLLHKNDSEYDYYMGEYYIYVERNDVKALQHYFSTLKKTPVNSRFYAMACFAIANNYSAHKDMVRYEKYLIKACISDVMCCTKENLALQDLAMYLFKQDENNIERAESYINTSMEDAKFYNNRLRILEISQKLPTIVSAYQSTVNEKNRYQKLALIFISLLVIGLFISTYLIVRQNNLLTSRRKELSKNNGLLTKLNKQLSELNSQLINTNNKRESLARLYINLCAKYIDKLNKYQILVKRKIKANQVNELLSTISSSKLSEEDATIFINRFDKAFLDLYPTFIEEINNLLKEDYRIVIAQNKALNTELRIFALIRLGVKDSSEIADLLFYSPQTIYNYRSALKNRAINRDTFEADVLKLCTVIRY
jgi:hypothetical protein